MEAEYWYECRQTNDLGFHQPEGNALFAHHFDRLNFLKGSRLLKGRRIFVPLCGKTRDMAWLLANGFRMVGTELSEIAVRQFIDGLGVNPTIGASGDLTRYSAVNLDLFVGDIFALSAAQLGAVDAVYDRAALVSLPAEMRRRYPPSAKTHRRRGPTAHQF
ncbi:hypothetical protein [Acanthopleuribacter pedis]|uniref:Thiopurine S-methyltransferase n=1 Tax=Acanthopleuribacter pedis TaxID=442870 RepID=A0A8J7U2L1_9BACT|nr:hypothetical protein [Acanthopleuribacter pedis]MBO1318707.1 hypothetical protein [Acanthopleuribacter pedis]